MKDEYSYLQFRKKKERHIVIEYAIKMLTQKREEACCVSRDYVRRVYDHFTMTEDDSRNKEEALKIDKSYIRDWERLHDVFTGMRRPEDLKVCYLCGPEPSNDFLEFTDMGVLPHNIWAFETDKMAYKRAITAFNENVYPQPRIVKQNIESFLRNTPKVFDIIYVDACGSVPSSQHALRIITTVFENHRLSSPGVIITNVTEPDDLSVSKRMISDYLQYKNSAITQEEQDCDDLRLAYGEFVSCFLRDIPGIIVPSQRMLENQYLLNLLNITDLSDDRKNYDKLSVGNHALSRYFLSMYENKKMNNLDEKSKLLLLELGDFDKIVRAMRLYALISNNAIDYEKEFKKILDFVENENNTYRFLDRQHSNIIVDCIINQLTYPNHYVAQVSKRYSYTAKARKMYTDITVYDECRYIYEWLPAVHQIINAYRNVSWQYVFRFAVDGLVKSRCEYNNEYFYQAAVVSRSETGFGTKLICKREEIE